MVSSNSVARLGLYRRLLEELRKGGVQYIFSHQLAPLSNVTAAQVRRDVMPLGCSGNPAKGYAVAELSESIGQLLDAPEGERVALVGVGNLGRAIISYVAGRRPGLAIVAAFDTDAAMAGRVIHGCRCYHLDELPEVVEAEGITVGIITVPAAAAQAVADRLLRAGVRGILNFAPTRLRVPAEVTVEDLDVTLALEKVAFLARQRQGRKPVWK